MGGVQYCACRIMIEYINITLQHIHSPLLLLLLSDHCASIHCKWVRFPWECLHRTLPFSCEMIKNLISCFVLFSFVYNFYAFFILYILSILLRKVNNCAPELSIHNVHIPTSHIYIYILIIIFPSVYVLAQDVQIDVCAILNDTTGTLMSCAWKNHNCKIGLIVGTSLSKLLNFVFWCAENGSGFDCVQRIWDICFVLIFTC